MWTVLADDKKNWSIPKSMKIYKIPQRLDTRQPFNLYTVDARTSEIKCSFSIYNKKGELIIVSKDSGYPCE
ncbi:hypothetical protein COY16_05015 [Candidatus Roizmanbacteria bacterium CG_4_10_14_0_2_um_filter_39_13]|uniref:Uncharacterized protein n=1 Tax=Candidatus Roizmanbacteria bacterium CG_4_10_14_0_2_um_filter_39_13 TaxID=1974825 RepID=A0A2M7TWS1_9BACT|nr:MAG: hypothetical protein COY16_05015 [Candidatus Roizmanbacteria bacterium CG_4_10_14_0_2_um_filter_39_13]